MGAAHELMQSESLAIPEWCFCGQPTYAVPLPFYARAINRPCYATKMEDSCVAQSMLGKMRLSHRAILVSFAGNAITALPLLLWHGFPFLDSFTLVAIIAFFGAIPAIRASWAPGVSLEVKRVLVGKFALFFPVLVLLLYALGSTVVRYQETGLFLPQSNAHWLSLVFAPTALIGWFIYFHRAERRAEKA